MRVIIAGSRRFPSMNITDPGDWDRPQVREVMLDLLETVVTKSKFPVDVVISGHAWGVDRLGELYAEKHKLPVELFVPDWSKGKRAGFLRNQEMCDWADAAVILMAENSAGSADMLNRMQKAKKSYFAVVIGSKEDRNDK